MSRESFTYPILDLKQLPLKLYFRNVLGPAGGYRVIIDGRAFTSLLQFLL